MKLLLRNDRGFTLIEVVAVLVLIGILSAMAYSRFVNTGVDLFQAAEALKSHLRYAQSRAMNSDPYWGIQFAADSYTLMYREGGSDHPVNLPFEESPTLFYPGVVSMSSLPATNPLYFNYLGVPIDQDGNPVTADITLSFFDGASSRSFTVVQDTGFIQ